MKSTQIKTMLSMMVIALVMISSSAYSQPGPRNGQGKANLKEGTQCQKIDQIPSISEDQKASIEKLRTQHLKDVLPLRNSLREKQAHLNTISTLETVDQKAIDKQIEEIGQIKTQMMKVNAKHRQDVRKVLNADQRIYFDAHQGKGRGGNQGKRGPRPDCPNR